MTVRELITRVGFKIDEASAKKAENRTKVMSTKMKLAFTGILTGLLMIGKKALDAAGEMEMLTTQFEVMLGSQEKGQEMMKNIAKFAAETPFEMAGLAKSSQQLLAYGIESEKILPTLRMLGDTAQGSADNLGTLARAFGRIQATGKGTRMELDMINDRGIGIYKELAKMKGVTVADILEMTGKSQVSAEDVQKAFENMTSAGGMFFEGMKKQSMTFQGLVSTMQDSLKMLFVDVGQALLPAMKLIIDTITKLIDGPLKEFVKILTDALVPILSWIVDLLNPLLEILNPILKIVVEIIDVFIRILRTLLEPVLSVLMPIIDFIAEILNIILDVLEALLPFFEALGIILKVLGGVLNIVVILLRPFLQLIGNIAYMFGKRLAVVLKLIAFVLEPLIWLLEKLAPAFELLARGIDFVFNTVLRAIEAPLQWMGEKLMFIIDGLREIFSWLAEIVGIEGEPPSVTKSLESGTLENRTANITMNNQIAMTTAAGPVGGLGEAAKSIFTLELQKIMINTGY